MGISGYAHKAWRGQFYPEGLAARHWLRYAASVFDTIELNGTFYSLKSPDVFRRWIAEVPSDFLFAVKGSRFITHNLKLRNAETVTSRFVYVRLHGSRQLYTSDYTDEALVIWAERIARWTSKGARRLRLLRQRREGARALRRATAMGSLEGSRIADRGSISSGAVGNPAIRNRL